jgi:glycosyltransferase involved in cell wall biosynthesis
MEPATVTPLILTYNEAPNIGRTLASLAWAARVVVVDSESTDDTKSIAASFENVDFFVRPFDDHASQWNYGLDRVETDWVLSLDADYGLSEGAVDEIAALNGAASAYEAAFEYRILGRPLRGTLYPPRVILFRPDEARYEQDGHTQRLQVDGTIGRLDNPFFHDDRKPLSAWLDAQASYSKLEAEKLTSTPIASLGRIDRVRRGGLLMPFLMPLYCLIWKRLILDGKAGLYYTFQRTYAELLLALRIWAIRLQRGDA